MIALPIAPRPLRLAARGLFAAAFLAAGLLKWSDPAAFASSLRVALPFLAERFVLLGALWLPALEIVLALALWLPAWRRGALLGSTLLLAAFCVFLGHAWLSGRTLECGCFGALSAHLGSTPEAALLRNAVLFGLLALAREPLEAASTHPAPASPARSTVA
jgi:uncharacterized membrane protein